MRKKFIAGNWKMNLSFDEGRQLFHSLVGLTYDPKMVEVMIAPPALYLASLSIANSSDVLIAAQTCHEADSGAYTGEWSASMLDSIGIKYCILGHSERRSIYGETDDLVHKKLMSCCAQNITPILCCGETLEERKAGTHFDRVTVQVETAIEKLKDHQAKKLIIAYEPVWAIGTGVTASSYEAQEMHQFIRKIVLLRFGQEVADAVRIVYGGSMKPANAAELLSMPDVDGGLIGGASLDFASFKEIISLA